MRSAMARRCFEMTFMIRWKQKGAALLPKESAMYWKNRPSHSKQQ